MCGHCSAVNIEGSHFRCIIFFTKCAKPQKSASVKLSEYNSFFYIAVNLQSLLICTNETKEETYSTSGTVKGRPVCGSFAGVIQSVMCS